MIKCYDWYNYRQTNRALATFLQEVTALQRKMRKIKPRTLSYKEREAPWIAFERNPFWNYRKHDDIMDQKWTETLRVDVAYARSAL